MWAAARRLSNRKNLQNPPKSIASTYRANGNPATVANPPYHPNDRENLPTAPTAIAKTYRLKKTAAGGAGPLQRGGGFRARRRLRREAPKPGIWMAGAGLRGRAPARPRRQRESAAVKPVSPRRPARRRDAPEPAAQLCHARKCGAGRKVQRPRRCTTPTPATGGGCWRGPVAALGAGEPEALGVGLAGTWKAARCCGAPRATPADRRECRRSPGEQCNTATEQAQRECAGG